MNYLRQEHILEYEFVWKISNFRASTFRNTYLIPSPFFEPKTFDRTVWLISLVLEDPSDSDYMGLYLRRISQDQGPPSIRVAYMFSLLNKNGELKKSRFNLFSSFKKGTTKGFKKLILRNEIFEEDSNFLLDDTLTLKGLMWKMSHWNAPVEKVFIRSKLEGEILSFMLRISPWQYRKTHIMHCNAVKGGFNLIFKWDSWEMEPTSELRFPNITVEPLLWVESDTFMTAQICILDKSHKLSFKTEGFHCFKAGSDSPWCLPSFDGPRDLYSLIDIDDLNFVCEFTVSNGEQEDIFDSTYASMHEECLLNPGVPPFRNILANAMKSEVVGTATFADTYVKVGKVTIRAHRVVLSARSPLFHKLFAEADRRWKSAKSSLRVPEIATSPGHERLDIAVEKCGLSILRSKGWFVLVFSDAVERDVRMMLSFIYTDDIDDVDFNTAVHLLHESNRYLIDGLKEWCESFLVSRINKANVWELGHLAKKLGCELLLTSTQLFCFDNALLN